MHDPRSDDPADPAPPRTGPPPGVLVLVLGLLLVAFALVPLAFLPPVADELAVAPVVGTLVTAVVHGVIALGLAAGAAGLVLGASAGWWAAAISAGANVLYQGKLLAFYAGVIRWSHPRAGALGWEIGLRYGLVAGGSLALLVALLLPGTRARFGLRSTPYVRRRRRTDGRPSS